MLRINTAILLQDHEEFDGYEEEAIESTASQVSDSLSDSPEAESFNQEIIDNSESPVALPDELCPIPEPGGPNAVPIEPEWDQAAEHAKDDAAFIAKLREIGDDIDANKDVIARLTAALKEAKAELKVNEKKLLRISKEGPQYRKKPEPKPALPTAEQIAVANGMAAAMDAAVETTEGEPNQDDSWRSIKTETFIGGIERFGIKKQEAVIELYPTLGDLEDLRGKASIEHAPFHELLPKGIGQGIADELERRMEEAIRPPMRRKRE